MRFSFLVLAFLLILPATCESRNYTHIKLVKENAVVKPQNLDPCQNSSPVSSGTCECTSANHPTGCVPVACESSTQTHPCLCTGTDTDTPTCECTSVYHQTGCTCSTSYHLDGCSCNMKAGQQYSLEQGLACMRSIPLTSNEKPTTIDLLKNYLSGYVFLDTSLNPPGAPIGYGKHAVDIMGTLDAIGANESYTNTFDFYEDIMVILNNLKDPHTIFTPPCIQKFIYLVVGLQIHKNTTDSSYYVTSGQYEVKYINWQGNLIYKNENELNEGTQDPIYAISQFADEEVSISKNPITRLNQALKYNLQQRSAQQFKHPDSNQITMQVIVPADPSGIYTSTSIVQVYASGDVGQLKDECPLNSGYSILGSYGNKDGIWMKIKIEGKKILNKTLRQLNGLMKRMKKNDDENEKRRHFEELMHKLDEEQTKITRDIEEIIHPKPLIHDLQEFDKNLTTRYTNQDDIITLINIAYKTEINDEPLQFEKLLTYSESGSDQVIAYHIPSLDLGVLVITTFGPDNLDSFAQAIFDAIKEFTNSSGTHKSSKLMIDVRGNGGGKVVAGRQTLNFIFPQAGHPIYQTVDQMKTTSNNELTKYMAYASSNWLDTAEIALDVETMQGMSTFYTQGNRKRTTTSPTNTSNTLTVDLTDKYVLYMGNNDFYLNKTTDWSLKRKELFSPENVLVITDGVCGSTCSQFVKHIGEKHLGRVAGIGLLNPLDLLARFDIGMATSATVTNVESIQLIKQDPYYDQAFLNIDKTKLPNNLFRSGTRLTYSDRGGYGFTEESKESLYEYYIVDPDFRVEHEPYNDANNDISRIQLYQEVLQQEDQILSSTTGQPKKCLSWEVDFDGAADKENCKACIQNDPYAIYGHPCSTRGQKEIDGSSTIGVVDSHSCIFSHCRVGYYRKKVVIGGEMKQQCIQIPLGPNQNEIDITPNKTLDIITDSDICSCSLQLIGSTEQPNFCSCTEDYDLDDCILQQCKSNTQNYPCLCTGSDVDTPNCICSESNLDSIVEGSCTCDTDHHPPNCLCASNNDINCVCSKIGEPKDCKLLKCTGTTSESLPCECVSGAEPTGCISLCTSDSDTSVEKDSCICTPSKHPINCRCPTDLTGIGIEACPCLTSDDPRAGLTCPITRVCEDDDQLMTNCLCSDEFSVGVCTCTQLYHDDESCLCDEVEGAQYDLTTCQATKTCISIDPNLPFGCTPECDVDSTETVDKDSCICTTSNHPINCKCPTDSAKLVGIIEDRCECRSTADPRANGICPAYCSDANIPSPDCVCDTNPSAPYPPLQCQPTKPCIKGTFTDPLPTGCTPIDCISPEQEYACKCAIDNDPQGCICPPDLDGISITTCPCLNTNDPRAILGGTCPQYCESSRTPVGCRCDTESISYDPTTCANELKCQSGEYPSKDNCNCDPVDAVCKAGQIDPTSLFFHNNKIDEQNTVTIDYRNIKGGLDYTGKTKITDFNPINKTAKVGDEKFIILPEESFDTLKTSQALNDSESQCKLVDDSRKSLHYGLYGYSAYVYANNKDISPSITALLKNSPNKIRYSNVPLDEQFYYTDIDIEKSCETNNANQYFSFGMNKEGIIETDCINNSNIPDEGDKCTESSIPFEPILKDYQEGHFRGINVVAMKDLIIRFGPVLYTNSEADFGLIVGWQKIKVEQNADINEDNWVEVQLQSTGEYNLVNKPIKTTAQYEGIVIFNSQCLDIYAECNPIEICKSNTQNYPCLCTGSDVDTPNCICSESNLDSIVEGNCTCDTDHHPPNCLCASNNDINCVCSKIGEPKDCKLLKCTGTTSESLPCECVSGAEPTGCISLSKCVDITASTPNETCPCPTDATKLADDPRKDGICKLVVEQVDTTQDSNICKDIPSYIITVLIVLGIAILQLIIIIIVLVIVITVRSRGASNNSAQTSSYSQINSKAVPQGEQYSQNFNSSQPPLHPQLNPLHQQQQELQQHPKRKKSPLKQKSPNRQESPLEDSQEEESSELHTPPPENKKLHKKQRPQKQKAKKKQNTPNEQTDQG